MDSARGRLRELDVMRGFCALAVVLYHYCIRFDALVGFSGIPDLSLDVTQGHIRQWGLSPVYVFFMISGFVITMTLERCRTVGEFAASRFSRIFPAYWAAIVITHFCWELRPAFPYHLTTFETLLNFSMLQEFLYMPNVDGVYWSLAAELAFYAAMAALLWMGWLRHLRAICVAWLLISLVNAATGSPLPHRLVMLLNLDFAQFFIAGIMLYRLWKHGANRFEWMLLLGCAIAILARYPLGPAACLLTALGIFIMIAAGRLSWIARGPFLYLGAISYSLYLTHQMIGYQVLAALPWAPPVRVIVTMAITISIASLLTFLVERPAQKLIRAYLAVAPSGVARAGGTPVWPATLRARVVARPGRDLAARLHSDVSEGL